MHTAAIRSTLLCNSPFRPFKGSEYWTYNGDEVDPSCPRRFSDFPGVPADIDTAWVRNDYVNVHGYFIYIFKGKDVWVIRDPVHNPRLDNDFEQELRSIEGFPGNLDAALSYGGKTYFFKGDDYYLIEGKQLKVGLINFHVILIVAHY